MSNKNNSNDGNNRSVLRTDGYSPSDSGRVKKGYKPTTTAKPASPPPPPQSGTNVTSPTKNK